MSKKNGSRPLIGVTQDFNGSRPEFGGKEPTCFLRTRYLDVVWDLGGIPIPLAISERKKDADLIFSKIDGLLLTGSGPDVPPSLYHEEQLYPFSLMDPYRYQFEIYLCRLALAQDKPLLGICGGNQLLNVALKGSLYQDISSQMTTRISHQQSAKYTQKTHWITVVENTLLFKIVGRQKIKVNSSHHQAVKKPGKNLRINALSPDGVIEGVESKNHSFVIGVQWHPECLYKNDLFSKNLFKSFIEHAKTKS